MLIPLLHPRRQFLLRPLLCHDLVLLALTLGQLPLKLAASSLVGAEEAWRSRCTLQKLNHQLVYLLVVHGGHNVKVWPFLHSECSHPWPFKFAIQILADKLEISENGPMYQKGHICLSQYLFWTLHLRSKCSQSVLRPFWLFSPNIFCRWLGTWGHAFPIYPYVCPPVQCLG